MKVASAVQLLYQRPETPPFHGGSDDSRHSPHLGWDLVLLRKAEL